MANLSCFPNLSQSITSILRISEFNDWIGIRKFSSHIGFKLLSILLLLTDILVFIILIKQYGSLNPLESADGKFEALIKLKLISHLLLGSKAILSSIISPSNGLPNSFVTLMRTLINPVFFPFFWTSIHFL